MRYRLRHRVTYIYETPVPESHQIMRMLPVDRQGQTVDVATLQITPEPLSRRKFTDFFGNAAIGATINVPHNELVVETRGDVVIDRPDPNGLERTPDWQNVRDSAGFAGNIAPGSPVHFIFPSPLVPLNKEITNYAALSFNAGAPVGLAALDLARRIADDFAYDPQATDVTTPIDVSFGARAGVCQDFAHIMVCGLRGLGIPSRYVSGYLRTTPAPGLPRLAGADATHAWVDVWCGSQIGWLGFDPTNALAVHNDHIVLALGRDYADVAPIEGVIRLVGGHDLKVEVDVLPAED